MNWIKQAMNMNPRQKAKLKMRVNSVLTHPLFQFVMGMSILVLWYMVASL